MRRLCLISISITKSLGSKIEDAMDIVRSSRFIIDYGKKMIALFLFFVSYTCFLNASLSLDFVQPSVYVHMYGLIFDEQHRKNTVKEGERERAKGEYGLSLHKKANHSITSLFFFSLQS